MVILWKSWQWKNCCKTMLLTRWNCFLTNFRNEVSGNELVGNSNLNTAKWEYRSSVILKSVVLLPSISSIYLSITKCGGPDSNRRTPTGMDPKSIAFNLARQPPQWYPTFKESILKVFKIG